MKLSVLMNFYVDFAGYQGEGEDISGNNICRELFSLNDAHAIIAETTLNPFNILERYTSIHSRTSGLSKAQAKSLS